MYICLYISFILHLLQKYVISFGTCVIFADMIEQLLFFLLSLFFHLTAVYFILSLPLFIYPLLSNSFMRFLLTSRNIFSLTLDLFHLVHPLAYTNTLVYMDTCARVQGFVIEQDRSLQTKKWFLNDYGILM